MPLNKIYNKLIKFTFDFVFSLLVILTVLSWLVPLIALIIKLTSKGPVFFKQKRLGLGNNVFSCIKFRTMYLNNEAETKPADINDSRITPIGKYLRKSHLDELPQFFNVIIGDMSVVGPRPHMLKQSNEYASSLENYAERGKIKPGVTGLAQLTDFNQNTPYSELMKKRNNLDLWYLYKWSLWLDFKIVALTVLKITRIFSLKKLKDT